MQFKSFVVPLFGNDSDEDEFNLFLRQHRVISVNRDLIEHNGSRCWIFLVEYLNSDSDSSVDSFSDSKKKGRVDYKKILNPDDFDIFSKLREVRKKIAEEKGIPVYAVLTNDQLSDVVTKRITTKSALKEIPGIGDQKVGLSVPILDFMNKLVDESKKSSEEVASTNEKSE